MKGLNWFQSRDLCALELRAVRMEGWSKWLQYREHQFLVAEQSDGAWVYRVPLNSDLDSAAYMSKQWTDEVWEGGTYPPCSTPGPTDKLARGNYSGGLASWGSLGQCAGAGTGGNTIVIGIPGDGDGGLVRDNSVRIELPLFDGATTHPEGASFDDAGRCFLAWPVDARGPWKVSLALPLALFGGDTLTPVTSKVIAYISRTPWEAWTVLSDHGPFYDTEFTNAAGPIRLTVDSEALGTVNFVGDSTASGQVFEYPSVHFFDIDQQPGNTFYAQVSAVSGSDGVSRWWYGKRKIAGWCPATPIAVTLTASTDDAPDGSYEVTGVGDDGELGTDDDTHGTVACWASPPDNTSIHIEASVTGGRPGETGTLTVAIDGTAVSIGSDTSVMLDQSIPFSAGSSYTITATYTQAAGVNGPELSGTATVVVSVASLCPP